MTKPYRVYVIKIRDCRQLVMRYCDPTTGKYVRSTVYRDPETGIETQTGTNLKEAKLLAERWERDLNAGRARRPVDISWREFRERYETEKVPDLAERTGEKISGMFNAVERLLPRVAKGKLRDFQEEEIAALTTALRPGRSPNSVASILMTLKAALRWAAKRKMIYVVPNIEMPARVKKGGGRGRPLAGEEFDRMIAAIPAALAGWRKLQREQRWKANRKAGKREHKMHTDEKPQVIAAGAVESWQKYLTGLWLSGLRLEESLVLSWDRMNQPHIILTGKRPMMRIPGDCQKNGKDQLCPITPDFAEHLLATPECDRRGFVYEPLLPSGKRANGAEAGRMISLIGEKAHVVVNTNSKTGKIKWASAHDLRRSFGTRWAKRVTTPVLQRLMRHASINTAMEFYVDLDAAELAEDLYRVHGQEQAASR